MASELFGSSLFRARKLTIAPTPSPPGFSEFIAFVLPALQSRRLQRWVARLLGISTINVINRGRRVEDTENIELEEKRESERERERERE